MADTRSGFTTRALSAVAFASLTALLVLIRGSLQLESILLLYVLLIVAVSLVAGVWAAQLCAVAALFTTNYFFVAPLHTLRIASRDDVVTLVVFVLVAALVSVAAELAARQRARAAELAVETRLLARAAAAPASESDPTALLSAIRDSFGYSAVSLEHHRTAVASAAGTPHADERAQRRIDLGAGYELVVIGDERIGEDSARLLRLGTAAVRAAESRALADVDRARSALLAAVGHDLRTPIAGITAAAAGLQSPGLDAQDHAALVATVAEGADRLRALVDNLLDVSRLRAGVLAAQPVPISLEEVVPAALGAAASTTELESLPLVLADPGMLERVLANLLDNVHRHAATDWSLHSEVTSTAVRLSLADHGPGMPVEARAQAFEEFQRSDDSTPGGLGLGLAVARGFMEAMGGSLDAGETPGGGLTMTLTLRRAT